MPKTTIPHSLKKQWWILCFFCIGSVLVGFFVLLMLWHLEYTWRWLWQTILVLLYVLGRFRSHLSLNHRKGETVLLATLGVGNLITVFRGTGISMLAGFLFFPWPKSPSPYGRFLIWLPGTLYMIAACADYFDGFLARITNHTTLLGELFDTKIDALGLLIAVLVAMSFGQLPPYYAIVGVAYYFLNIGIWLRRKAGKPVFELAPWAGARMLAGFQMGFVGFALLPVLAPPVTTIAAMIFMIPFLSGFIRDWLVICGHIQTNSEQWRRIEQHIKNILTKYLPLVLRFIVIFWAGLTMFQNEKTYLFLEMKHYLWERMTIIAFLMIVFGIAGRIASFLLSFSTGLMIMKLGTINELILIFSCSLILMQTGTGMFSLWQPEERIIFKRAGEKSK